MIARLAWRSLWRHRRRTIITVSSIALGLAIMVIFGSLAEGLYRQLVDDAVRMQAGHLTLEHPKYRMAPAVDLRITGAGELRRQIGALPSVDRTKGMVLGQGVLRSGADAAGVIVMGIEPDVEKATSPLARKIVGGSYLEPGDGARVVIGVELARNLKVSEGKKVVLSTNDARGELVEALFRIEGIFETGSPEIDTALVQAPLGAIQRLYGYRADEVTQVGVLLHDADEQRRALHEVRRISAEAPVAVRPWQEVIPELAAFIQLDRFSNWMFQGLLLVLVLFTIFNTLLMSVLDRERELAILLAIGTPPRQLRLQILVESVLLGILGSLFGLVLGGGLALLLQVYGIDLTALFTEGMTFSGLAVSTRVHSRITPGFLAILVLIVFTATVLMSLVPLRRAGRVPVVETLR